MSALSSETNPDFRLRLFQAPPEGHPIHAEWSRFCEDHLLHLCDEQIWQESAVRTRTDYRDFRIWAGYNKTQLVGVVPQVLVDRSFAGLPATRWEFPEQGVAFGSMAILPNFQAPFLTAMQNHPAFWGKANLVSLTLRNPAATLLPDLSGSFLGLRRRSLIKPLSPDQLTFTPQRRRWLSKTEKRLSRWGSPSFRPANETFQNAWKMLLDIYGDSRKNQLSRSLTTHQPSRDFYQILLARAWQEERTEVRVLYLDDLPIATIWWICRDREAYGVQMAFREKYSSASPGSFLLYASIRDLGEAGFQRLHLLGNHPYKQLLDSEAEEYLDFFLFRPGFYGWLLKKAAGFSPYPFQKKSLLLNREEQGLPV